MHAVSNRGMIWRVSLARIEQIVSAHLGPGRVRGNVQGPCFSRQVSMYLARHVGRRWSLSQIGKFYNGRHHTTVLHAISKIERFRRSDESVDALIEVLTGELAAGPHESGAFTVGALCAGRSGCNSSDRPFGRTTGGQCTENGGAADWSFLERGTL